MGFLSGALSAVGSMISGACSICSKIGGAMFSGIASGILNPISKLFPALQIISVVVHVVGKVAELLIGKPEVERPEEMAMRAEDAELKPEDFSSFDEYMEYLRNDIKTDHAKLESLSDEERQKYEIVGTGMYIRQMEGKYGISLDPRFWYATNRLDLKEGDTANLVKTMKENEVSDGANLKDYMDGNLKSAVSCKAIYDSLDQMLQQRDAPSTETQRAMEILEMRKNYQKKGV